MRVTIESAGFTAAADACHAANEIAAITTETLAGKLRGLAGMAGNDATSSVFAKSYDDAAREAVATLTQLTDALAGLGRLIETTGENHRRAEAASAGHVDGRGDTAGRGGTKSRHETPHPDRYTHICVPDPPSALGPQEPALGTIDTWILDHVEGFAWPGADTALLRDAAHSWRSAAASIEHLTHHLDDTSALLARQRSPEIPLALDTLDNTRGLITGTATHLGELAHTCDDYATAVEDTRNRTKTLLTEIGQMIIEGAVLSAAITAITGGLGGTATATAVITRITAHAPRFRTLTTSLHIITTTTATRARAAHTSLRSIRTRLDKLARGERGTMKNPLGWSGGTKPGWLKGHEVPPGHTLERHVGKTVEELAERIAREGKKRVSTFDDQGAAERIIDEALSSHRQDLKSWIAKGDGSSLVIDMDLGKRTGMSLLADGSSVTTSGVRIVLIPKPHASGGWQILTAYPR